MPHLAARDPRTARDRILDTASDLFYQEGLHVGIDRILARSGVAKRSLYNHFPSKNDLILAFLERRHARWMAWLQDRVAALAPDPAGRPLAVFGALQEWFDSDDFRGCAFINAAAELADPRHPGFKAAVRHKRQLRDCLEGILREAGVPHTDRVASQLLLLVEGATVAAVIGVVDRPGLQARALAAGMLTEGLHQPTDSM